MFTNRVVEGEIKKIITTGGNMAKNEYFARGSVYSMWSRAYGDNMVDVDSVPICNRAGCKKPLAVIETVFDTGKYFKVTTITETIAKALGVRAYLVFYKPIPDGTKVCKTCRHNNIQYDPVQHKVEFKVQRLVPSKSDLKPMSEQEWHENLVALQLEHDWDTGHIWKANEDGKFVAYGKNQDNLDSKGNLIKK
jgi:hypothetical protein